MKQKIAIAALIVLPVLSQAQLGGFLNKVKNKVTQKANQRIDNKVDKAIDKSLDEMEGKTAKAENPSASSASEPAKQQAGVVSFSKYDFVPGEKIVYAEDFAQEAIGELPLGWNSTGKAEVVSLDALPGKWLKMHQNSFYLTANNKVFEKNFTVEFDLLLQFNYKEYTFPLLTFGLLSSNELQTTDNALLTDHRQYQAAEILLRPSTNGNSYGGLRTSVEKNDFFKSEDQRLEILDAYYNKPTHISMQVQESRLRVWVNGQKLFDLPKALATQYLFNQLFFKIHSSGYKDDQIGFYITNIKVATGVPDTRHKLMEEGKFSTTGILFDVNSATIKPESNGVIKEIGSVLKENLSIKIKIIGHTSSDGDDNNNLELSKKRAAAVKEALIKEYGINGDMIETEGKGETQPVGDNKTKEGKMQNRRVEFIKL
jgi:OmpA-OmpF porin, OOP family